MRRHLEAVWRQTGRKPAELAGHIEMPPELAYLIEWLALLPTPLTHSELHHWVQLTHRRLDRWELEALMMLDRTRSDG